MVNVKVISMLIDDVACTITYNVRSEDDKVIQSSREFLRPATEQDLVQIPTTLEDYKDTLSQLSDQDIAAIMYPKTLTALE